MNKAIKAVGSILNKGEDILNNPKILNKGEDLINDISVKAIKGTKQTYNKAKHLGNVVFEDAKLNSNIEALITPRGWVGKQIKKPYAQALALGSLAIGGSVGYKKYQIENKNRMRLGRVSPDVDPLPNQIETHRSIGFTNNANLVHNGTIDTLGADGQLAMSLHYLKGR